MKMFILFSLIVLTELCGQRITKLYAHDPARWDRFGRTVAINSEYLAISSRSKFLIHNDVGAVYLYRKNGDKFSYFKKVIPDSFYTSTNFYGSSVKLSSGMMYVGSKDRIHIYELSDTLVTLMAVLSPPDITQYYGLYFSEYDKDLMIGAYLDDISSRGAAYFYSYTDSGWVYKQKIKPDNLRSSSHFGRSSDFNDKYAVISAPRNGIDGEPREGTVFVYRKTDSGWVESQKITPPYKITEQGFGRNVEIDGDRVAISLDGGFTREVYHGRVYLYSIVNGIVKLQDSVFSPESFIGNMFGAVMELRGDSLFVSSVGQEIDKATEYNSTNENFYLNTEADKVAFRREQTMMGSAATYLFVYNGQTWDFKLKFVPPDAVPFSEFGASVSFIDGNFIVGCPDDSTYADWSGAAYLFQPNLVSAEEIHDGFVKEFELMQNYPNPFNPATEITFTLPSGDNVRIVVYDLLGKEIATLVEGYLPAGSHTVKFNAFDVSSGIYFYSLQTKDYFKVKKLTLIK